jgi:hypothetical protein
MGSRAKVQEFSKEYPCWDGSIGRVATTSGSRRRSRTLETGLSKDIGQYEDPTLAGFPGFRMGTITAAFQMAGRTAELTDRLYSLVR